MIERLHIRTRGGEMVGYIDQRDLSQFERYAAVNGQDTLYLKFPPAYVYADSLTRYNRVMYYDTDKARWYEFIISYVQTTQKEITIKADNSICSLATCFVPFVDITGKTVVNGMYEAFELAYPASEWTVGTSDISGSYYMQRTRKTLKTVLYDWAAAVGGEVDPVVSISDTGDIERTVNIYSQIGSDTGKTLYDTRELTNISVLVPSKDVYTAAYGYGASVDGAPLTFADVEWSIANGDPVDKPLGQTYVSLGQDAINAFGNLVNGAYVDRCTVYTSNNAIAENLLEATYNSLVAGVVDDTEYKFSAADFAAFGIPEEELDLGDTVGVVLSALNLKFKTRCMAKRTNFLIPSKNTFEFNKKAGYLSDALTDIGKIAEDAYTLAEESYTESVLDRFNAEINADQAHVIADPLDGFNTYNTADPTTATKVTSVKGGSIRVANSKKAGQWDYKTILTGDGLLVNNLTTSTISGENFEFDLQTGLLAFGPRVNGVIKPIIQLQATGATILGTQVNGQLTADAIAFLNRVSNQIVAQFAADGAYMPTAIVEDELKVGNSRLVPATGDNAIMWVLND